MHVGVEKTDGRGVSGEEGGELMVRGLGVVTTQASRGGMRGHGVRGRGA